MKSDPKRNAFVLTGYHGVYGQKEGREMIPALHLPWLKKATLLGKTILSEYLIFLRKDRDGVKIRKG